jgi:hypothetical protein
MEVGGKLQRELSDAIKFCQFGAFVQARSACKGSGPTYSGGRSDGGKALAQLATVALRTEPFGAQQGDAINVVNLRTSKSFLLGGPHRVELDFDLFNLLTSANCSGTNEPDIRICDLRGAAADPAVGGGVFVLETRKTKNEKRKTKSEERKRRTKNEKRRAKNESENEERIERVPRVWRAALFVHRYSFGIESAQHEIRV